VRNPNLDTLLTEAVQTACHYLSLRGEFYPFCVALDDQGGLHHLQGYASEYPNSGEVIDLIYGHLKADAGQYCGVAVVTNVTLTNALTGQVTDAISVALEHVHADPVRCHVPYTFDSDVVVEGELVATAGERIVFT
jgi:hypothetical protein